MATLTETFSAIAAAIRSKNGKTETMTPAEMPAEIEALPTGGGDDLLFAIVNRAQAYSALTAIDVDLSNMPDNRLHSYALQYGFRIRSVKIPSGIYIDSYAFDNCYNMTDCNNGELLFSYIGGSAFSRCNKLLFNHISSGNGEIGEYAFSNCYAPNKFSILASSRINNNAFRIDSYTATRSYKKVWLSSDIEYIGGTSTSNGPFYGHRDLELYTDATEKPEAWRDYFNNAGGTYTLTVHYGVSLDEFEQLE